MDFFSILGCCFDSVVFGTNVIVEPSQKLTKCLCDTNEEGKRRCGMHAQLSQSVPGCEHEDEIKNNILAWLPKQLGETW
jgi:hypothetical protein